MKIRTIATGKAKKYLKKHEEFESAYKKDNFVDSIKVDSLGIAGDIQVDKRFHGGEDKAIHIGSYVHLDENPTFDKLFMGCNIIVDELTEDSVCAGDIYKVGEVRLEVTQPRQPCWKIGVIFGKEINRYIVKNFATGWYVRVLNEGTIKTSDKMVLEKRVSNLTIKDLSKYLKSVPSDRNIIEDILNLDSIAKSYKKDFIKKLGENNS
ncbi:MOSC domain-containing protein [Campylobacterota bacterium DY0563]|uniref:MOSC domain-containing protein n=1 Tax=Halarcobacter sp. TaxID=2321133 RepID=UPI0029F562FF|nr:MOSC domain-containing protein [Halarcobacter sp.]